MLDIIERFNELRRQENAARAALDQKIRERKAQLERLEKRRKKVPQTSWVEGIVEPLARTLANRTGLSSEIYGPFGLNCTTSIYLRKDMSKSIVEQPTRSITLIPRYGENLHYWDDDFIIYYQTGEKTNRYAPGTIGELNGMNNVAAPLPDTIEEIEKLLIYSDAIKKEVLCNEEASQYLPEVR